MTGRGYSRAARSSAEPLWAELRRLTPAINRQLERIVEYRQVLITAIVTGQFEIPVTEPEEVSV